jgi:hypothetical protein
MFSNLVMELKAALQKFKLSIVHSRLGRGPEKDDMLRRRALLYQVDAFYVLTSSVPRNKASGVILIPPTHIGFRICLMPFDYLV